MSINHVRRGLFSASSLRRSRCRLPTHKAEMSQIVTVAAAFFLAVMTPQFCSAQSPEPAVLEGAVKKRLVLDETFVKSLPAIALDGTFETDKGKSSGRLHLIGVSYMKAMIPKGCCDPGEG